MTTIDKDAKLQNNKAWMTNAWTVEQLSAGEIANLLNISTKLVHIKLKEFKLV